MDIQKIAPELRNVYRYLPPIPFHNRTLHGLVRLLLRLPGRPGLAGGVKVDKQVIGGLKVRVYQPTAGSSGAGLLWMHGGGFMVGSAIQDERVCAGFARDLGLVVVSVDYRLAPEHPFPAPLDDCFAAWRWFQDLAPDCVVDPARIAVGGQSAGAGLAACLSQRIYDSGGIPPAAQILIYPMLDDRTAADRSLDELAHPLWDNHNNRGGWTAYLGHEPGQPAEPEYAVASRREDLSGLPPAWIGVGDIDLFYRENSLYAERLNSAGVSCKLQVVPMAPHGFQVVAPNAPMSRDFCEKIYRFLIQTLNLKLEEGNK